MDDKKKIKIKINLPQKGKGSVLVEPHPHPRGYIMSPTLLHNRVYMYIILLRTIGPSIPFRHRRGSIIILLNNMLSEASDVRAGGISRRRCDDFTRMTASHAFRLRAALRICVRCVLNARGKERTKEKKKCPQREKNRNQSDLWSSIYFRPHTNHFVRYCSCSVAYDTVVHNIIVLYSQCGF